MYYGYTIKEIVIFGIAGIVALWSLFNILTTQKLESKFFYWFVFIASGFGVWLWRSGNGAAWYQAAKAFVGTP